jgi:hypothetical protein
MGGRRPAQMVSPLEAKLSRAPAPPGEGRWARLRPTPSALLRIAITPLCALERPRPALPSSTGLKAPTLGRKRHLGAPADRPNIRRHRAGRPAHR